MTNPAVSVVLPVYNCPQYVDEAINSIFAQTFDDFELIVIDDGSTDETPLLLRKYTDRRMTLIRQENRGLAATLNRGIELSKGRYVARQDQDDAIRGHRRGTEVRVAHPVRDERNQRQPKQEVQVRPQDDAIDVPNGLQEMMVIVPVNPDEYEAEQVTQQCRDHRHESAQLGRARRP